MRRPGVARQAVTTTAETSRGPEPMERLLPIESPDARASSAELHDAWRPRSRAAGIPGSGGPSGMAEREDGYVTDVAYTAHYHPGTLPIWISTAATIFGYTARKPRFGLSTSVRTISRMAAISRAVRASPIFGSRTHRSRTSREAPDPLMSPPRGTWPSFNFIVALGGLS